MALGLGYHHSKEPIPEAIVSLVKPVYNRLGSRDLLEKCLGGYTQNANEALCGDNPQQEKERERERRQRTR